MQNPEHNRTLVFMIIGLMMFVTGSVLALVVRNEFQIVEIALGLVGFIILVVSGVTAIRQRSDVTSN